MSAFDIIKSPRIEDAGHLKFLHTLPCIVSGQHGVDPAHIRYANRRYGKRETGGAERPDDMWCVPLSRKFHDMQHDMNEEEFWADFNIDPLAVASHLYAIYKLPTSIERRTKMAHEFVAKVTIGEFPYLYG